MTNKHSQSLYNNDIHFTGDALKRKAELEGERYLYFKNYVAEVNVQTTTGDENIAIDEMMMNDPEVFIPEKYIQMKKENKRQWEEQKAIITGKNFFEDTELKAIQKKEYDLYIENDNAPLIEEW